MDIDTKANNVKEQVETTVHLAIGTLSKVTGLDPEVVFILLSDYLMFQMVHRVPAEFGAYVQQVVTDYPNNDAPTQAVHELRDKFVDAFMREVRQE